jgi:hypothetical protein
MFETPGFADPIPAPINPTVDVGHEARATRLDAAVAAGIRRQPAPGWSRGGEPRAPGGATRREPGGAELAEPAVSLAECSVATPSRAEIEQMDADGCLELLRRSQRERSRWEAAAIRLMARLASLRPSTDPGRPTCTYVGEEVAAELDQSPVTTASHVSEAETLVRRLPAVVDALERGDIDLTRARGLLQLTDGLTDTQATAAAGAALSKGRRSSPAHFRRALRRIIHKLDPQAAERRRTSARATRDVRIDTRGDDGMATLHAALPAAEALLAYARIDHLARHCQPPGDARTLAQRRADVLLDLLLDRRPHPHVEVAVNVTVAASTLAGVDDQPAVLHGYGTISAGYARELAEQATWRRILTDAPGGSPLEVSRRRYPSPALARHIRARNLRCVFPACSVPAEACDLDHTDPYARGGETSEANLGPLCGRHHRMKDRPDVPWTLSQARAGHYEWTSPTGRTYSTPPDHWDDS